uniref:histidine kinase n=1 Tax=Caldimicrobium thiodismutans TaxID=1653476 RepID=A0A832GQ43_9BACT
MKKFFKKTSLPTQLSLILIFLLTVGYVIFLITINFYSTFHYNKIAEHKISILKEGLTSTLRPLIITEDYDKIEKYLLNIVSNNDVDCISLINTTGEPIITIVLENTRPKITYQAQEKRREIKEEIIHEKYTIKVTFPIKGFHNETMAWIEFLYNKKFLNLFKTENFLLITGLLLLGIFVIYFFIKFFFSFFYRDLQIFLQYLRELPFKKGKPLKHEFNSKDFQQLKALAEEISSLLLEQERQILQEKFKLEEILLSLREAVILVDLELKIIYFNRAFIEIAELDPSQNLIGKKLPELMPLSLKGEGPEIWTIIASLCNLCKVTEGGLSHSQTQFEEVYYRAPSGSQKILELSFRCLKNETFEGYLLILRDVTHKKRMEEEIQRIQKFEAIDKLAGGVAHDLRNLLAGLFNYFYILKRKIGQEAQIDTLLEKIEKLLNKANALSFQLLSLSKGGIPLRRAENILETIKEMVDFCLAGFPVQVELEVKSDISHFLFDPEQMAQVFQNLLINAREAMPDGGKLKIELELKELLEEEVPPLPAGKYLLITVSDTGVGIPEDILPKIFDPFFTTKEKGTGLGLSVVFQIIRNHGGHITVSSKVGVGTTFYIYLPYETASPEEEIGKEEIKEFVQKEQERNKILLVDDEEDIRETLKVILPELGYEVEVASQGEEAITHFKRALELGKPFDIVITDYVMPDITGDRLVKSLKTLYPNFLAILSTGYADIPVVSNYESFAFDKILLKPYTIEQLLKILKE